MLNNTLSVSTLTVLVMDCSTSMRRFGQQPRHELNAMLRTLRAEKGALATQLVVYGFNKQPFVLCQGSLTQILEIGQLPLDAGTRLFGTVADVLTSTLRFVQEVRATGQRANVIVAVITDGEDNLSAHDLPEVRKLAAHATRAEFHLEVIGLGVDGKFLAALMGFSVDHSVNLAATSEGLSQSLQSITGETTRLMRLGEKVADPKKQKPS